VRTLVDRFYDFMDQLPQAVALRALHPLDPMLRQQLLGSFFHTADHMRNRDSV